MKKNSVATFLTVIAWFIFIVGFILGIAISQDRGWGSDFKWGLAFYIWGGALFSGIFFLGFGEIISLLHKIFNSLNKTDSPDNKLSEN